MLGDAGANYVFDVRFKNVPPHEQRSAEAYTEFLRELIPAWPVALATEQPASLDLTDPKCLLRDLGAALSIESRPHVLIFNLVGAGDHELDDLATALYTTLKAPDVAIPEWFVFVISPNDEQDLRRSVVVRHLIDEVLNERKIGLLVQYNCQGRLPFLMTDQLRGQQSPIPILPPCSISSVNRADDALTPLLPDQVAEYCRVIFGHFSIATYNGDYHLPAVVCWDVLADNPNFVAQVAADMETRSGVGIRLIYQPLVEENGSEKLVAALQSRLSAGSRKTGALVNKKSVVLTELLAFPEQIDRAASETAKSGDSLAGFFALARYRDVIPQQGGNSSLTYYMELPYQAQRISTGCAFCDMDSQPVPASNLVAVKNNLNAFDPVTFWELIGSNPSFYSVGHKAVQRTGYHYHFRFIVRDLFKAHGYGLALRLRNAVQTAKIYPEWVRKIVCADDEELRPFAMLLAEVFGLSHDDVVLIPRGVLRSVTGGRIDPSVAQSMPDGIGSSLHDKNVLIVDQAAHHFRTVSSLATICKSYGSVVLAFAVVIDRVDEALRLTDHARAHYVRLYSWPCPPSRPNECPCES